jgi:hypothetical protein
MRRCRAGLALAGWVMFLAVHRVSGWDYEGHRLINQLALATLPTNFPAFVFSAQAQERVAFLGGEPDRWRNTPELALRHCHGPDHYLDLEALRDYELEAARLSPFRYEFLVQLAEIRRAHPERFVQIDPAKDADRTEALPGFLPWAIVEHFAKLKSAFSALNAYAEAGTPEEVANAQSNVLYYMGVLGHYVGDAAQPLHTTVHHHGWVGPNPRRYTTNYAFHAWIDGGFLEKAGLDQEALFRRVRPARLLGRHERNGATADLFPTVVRFLVEQHAQVQPLYELDRKGQFSLARSDGAEGRAFLAGQMLQAAQFLGDLWLTAARHAPPDAYLNKRLSERNARRQEAASSP